MKIYSVCKHCGEGIWRYSHSRKWHRDMGSATCDFSPIGLHQWNGSYTTEITARMS